MSRNLASAFLALAKRWPDRPAIESSSRKLTFQEMMKAAGAVAEALAAHGVNSESRIGITMSRNDEAFIVVLGTWLAGATALVADFRARAAERQKVTEVIGLDFFVEDRPAPGGDDYPAFRIKLDDYCEGFDLLDLPSPPGARANPVAVIGLSSGTTGLPQPVALSHECLFARYAIARTSPQWVPGGCLAVSAPLAFSATRKHVISRLLDGGMVFFLPLLTGAREFADFVNTSHADAVLTVPSVIRDLLPLASPGNLLFPNVNWLMSCGAPMSPQEKLDACNLLSSGFVQNYGSTMAGMITLLETSDLEKHSHSVGRPLPHVLTEIVDSEGNQVPTGETGNIRVHTPGTADNLLTQNMLETKMPELRDDGWIYPGDLGFLDEEGFLYIVGRSSDVIIRGGINVFPAEVENVLIEHAAVTEAAVVGWPDVHFGEEIAAFVVLRRDTSTRELLAWCRSRLQPDKQPRDIFVIESMPRNANGKLDKRNLVSRLPER